MIMTKEEAVKTIMKSSYGDETKLQEFQEYIEGTTEIKPKKLEGIDVYFFTSKLKEVEEEEALQVLRRTFGLISELAPKAITTRLYDIEKRYEFFKKLELKDAFVEDDFVSKVFQQINMLNPIYSLPVIKKLNDSLRVSYPSVFEKWRKELSSYTGQLQAAAILLMIYGAKSGAISAEDLEGIAYSIIKKRYAPEEMKASWLKCQKAKDSWDSFQKHTPIAIEIEDSILMNLSYTIYWECLGLSHRLDDAIRTALSLESFGRLISKSGGLYQSDALVSFLNQYQLPDNILLKLAVYEASAVTQNIRLTAIYDVVDELYERNAAIFFDVLEETLPETGFLLSYLLRKGVKEAEAYLPKLEDYLIQALLQWKQENLIIVDERELELNDFECLRKKEFQASAFSGNLQLYNYDISFPCLSAVYLIGYSTVAINVVKIMLQTILYDFGYRKITRIMRWAAPCKKDGLFEYLYQIGFQFQEILQVLLQEINHYKWNDEEEKELLDFLSHHKAEAEQGVGELQLSNEFRLIYLKLLYEKSEGFDIQRLESVFYLKSKVIANYAEKLLVEKEEEARPFVEKMKQAKSKMAADAALRLIRLWDNDKIDKELEQFHDVASFTPYIEALYTKNNEKNVPYGQEIDYSKVRMADAEECLPEILVKYYISEYIMLKDLYYVKTGKKIQDFANIYDLRALLKQIYDRWMSENAPTKYKNLLLPFALTAGESQLIALKKQIDVWSENSKPAMAAFAVQALCMNGSKMALLLVDTMSKKHKSKKVKAAATEALELTARELGLTQEELNDLIVPDLDFDKNRVRIFDYGKRKFTCTLNEKLEIILSDETGKIIKSLPKAAAKYEDNEDLAKAAKEDLKTIKKQIKVIVDSQKPRMFQAVLSGRTWTVQQWKSLFMDNPIMISFATGLIWAEKTSTGDILETFRYMEDGSLNTAEEEEYDLQENTVIGLLHPVDVSSEILEAWKQQLEDYEVVQPVQQLEIPVYKVEEKDRQNKELSLFKGKKVYGATVKSVAGKLGLALSFDNYGECTGCMYTDEKTNITLSLHHSSYYMGDYSAVVEIGDIVFTKEGNEAALGLGYVPPKLLSLALLVGETVTAKTVGE